MIKKLLLFLLVAGIVGAGVGYYLWNKPHEDIAAAKTDVAIDATQLFQEFNADETAATAKYLDKMIAVNGKVRSAETDAEGATKVIFETGNDFTVTCELDKFAQHPRTTFTPGESVTLKGLCSGFNFDVQMSRCVEVK